MLGFIAWTRNSRITLKNTIEEECHRFVPNSNWNVQDFTFICYFFLAVKGDLLLF